MVFSSGKAMLYSDERKIAAQFQEEMLLSRKSGGQARS